jgi:hypothetical protein
MALEECLKLQEESLGKSVGFLRISTYSEGADLVFKTKTNKQKILKPLELESITRMKTFLVPKISTARDSCRAGTDQNLFIVLKIVDSGPFETQIHSSKT